MSITRIQNNQITDSTIIGSAKISPGSLTGALFAPSLTFNSNIVINGNLTLGNTSNVTTLNATNTFINDPLVVFNNGYTGSLNGYDIGMLINRNLASLAPYGSVNAFLGWVEADQAFEAITTSATGAYSATTTTNIQNSGFANVKLGNVTSVSETVSGALTVSGNVAISNTVYTQGVYDNSNRVASFSDGAGNLSLSSGNITLPLSGPGNLIVAGDATHIPQITTDAYGRILTMSNVGVNTTVNLSGTTGTGSVAGGGTLTFAGTYGVTESVSGSTVTIGTPQDLRISATPTFNGLYSNVAANSLFINGNALVSNTGVIGLGSISNVGVTGGANGYTVTTNGAGVLNFNAANAVVLGANAAGQLISPAVTLTSGTNVTDAIAQLNQILGKLTPASPPSFPGNVATSVGAASTFSITTGTASGIMTGDVARGSGWTQKNNIAGNTYQLAGGTTFSAIRSNTYATSTLAAIKSGQGNVVVYLGGNIVAGYYTLTGSSGTNSNGNLTITNDTDYHSIVTSVAAGFWQSANISAAAGSGIQEGWNTVTISDIGGYTLGNTNSLLWYNDVSVVNVGTPTFSNSSMTMTTNTVVYSSTIPHLTNGAVFRLKGNVSNLSGDTYVATANTNITTGTTAGGAFLAPTAVATSSVIGPGGWAGTVPLPRYLCNATYGGTYAGTAYLETPSNITSTGFGSSSAGPSLTVANNYNSGVGSFSPGVTILYKNGTSTNIEETSIPVNSVGVGSGNGYRILNPGSTNTPTYTGSETAFNSTTSTLTSTDATNVGSGGQGIIQYDVTNYSTGYLPVGPNLSSGRGTTQYFTLKFVRTAVSKFDVKYTGTIAGLWIALPGQSETYSTLNGWYDMGTAYAGSGIPGAAGGGNGSNGCAVGGVAVFNSAQSNKSVTGTFGTLSSTSSTNNEIYVRVALTSGQSLTALSMEAATH